MTNLEYMICEAESIGEIDLDTRNQMLNIIYETSLDTALTTNPFKRYLTLYHASDIFIPDKIKPLRLNVGNKLDKNVRLSSFWSDNYTWSKYYGIGLLLAKISKELFNSKNTVMCRFVSNLKNGKYDFLIDTNNYNDIMNELNESVFYIYTKNIDKKYVGRGHSSAFPEFTIDIPVKPDEIDKIYVKDIIDDYKIGKIHDNINLSDDFDKFHIYKYSENKKRSLLKKYKNI